MQLKYRKRWYAQHLSSMLKKPFVHILFGARQTGKTFLLRHLVENADAWYNLADPAEKNRLLVDPGAFQRESRALPAGDTPAVIVVDEAQAVPAVFDAIQVLYDSDKERWRFVLCGSSARRLRTTGANLLPGRSILHHLFPLILSERPTESTQKQSYILPLPAHPEDETPLFPAADLHERLAYGDLPGIVLTPEEDRPLLLKSYAQIYLEEEIRRETMIRDWPAFVRFLQLAATHSGQMMNYASVSRQTGVSIAAIKSHYQLLEDIFIGFSISGFTGSDRRTLLSTPRFFFADLGVRHAAAGLTPDRSIVTVDPGSLFEQWVGIELWKRLQYLGTGRLSYLRAKSGMEIDYIVEYDGALIPVEVKWTETPSLSNARHVLSFLREQPSAKHGYVVCRCPRPQQLSETVTAIPWWMI